MGGTVQHRRRQAVVSANQRKKLQLAARQQSSKTFSMDDRLGVGYVRISWDREGETSTGTQEAIIRDTMTRMGIHCVTVLVDAGESAFKGKAPRPMFQKALDMIQSGAANTLMVYKLDRFMRNASTAVQTKEKIHSWGGSIISATEGIDTGDRTNTTGELIFNILAWIAEQESVIKSDRIRDWHNHRYQAEGGALPPTGPRPFGYVRVKKTKDQPSTLVIQEDEARVIQEAARMILEEGAGLWTLQEKLGHRCSNGWKHVLTSETTTGLRVQDGNYLEGNWPPILDRMTWQQLCDLLYDPARRTSPRGGKKMRVNLMASLLTCGACGGVMKTKSHQQGARYQCKDCTNSIRVVYPDQAVEAFIFEHISQEAWETLRAQGRGYDPRVMADFEEREAALTVKYTLGEISQKAWDMGLAALKDQVAKVQQGEYVQLPDVDQLHESWPSMSLEARRLVVSAVLKSVTIAPWVSQLETPALARVEILRKV